MGRSDLVVRGVPQTIMRLILLLCGHLSLALGVIGIFVPILPTTPFVLLASVCYSKSSPRFEAWLAGHRTLGPMVREWRRHRVIRPRAKLVATMLIVASLVVVTIVIDVALGVRILVAAILISANAFILSRRSAPPQLASGTHADPSKNPPPTYTSEAESRECPPSSTSA